MALFVPLDAAAYDRLCESLAGYIQGLTREPNRPGVYSGAANGFLPEGPRRYHTVVRYPEKTAARNEAIVAARTETATDPGGALDNPSAPRIVEGMRCPGCKRKHTVEVVWQRQPRGEDVGEGGVQLLLLRMGGCEGTALRSAPYQPRLLEGRRS